MKFPFLCDYIRSLVLLQFTGDCMSLCGIFFVPTTPALREKIWHTKSSNVSVASHARCLTFIGILAHEMKLSVTLCQ